MKPHLLLSVTRPGNQQLLARAKDLARESSGITASLVAHLSEIDRRRLYLGQACSSLFTYCTQVLHLSEPAAYRRIEAARAARRYPLILDLLAEGALHLTAVTLLSPHLTDDNHQEVLEAARFRSKREVEKLVAALRPRPPAPSFIRKAPGPRPAPQEASPASEAPAQEPAEPPPTEPPAGAAPGPVASPRRASVTPLPPECYRVQFTAGKELHEKLCRARDLLRHQIPSGDPAAVIDRALTLLVADLEKKKFAATERPRKSSQPASPRSAGTAARSRYIPAEVKRRVWKRDQGRCTFVAPDGRRCTETGQLEFDHKEAYAAGGESTAENLRLRCRAHNQYGADLIFGPNHPGRRKARRGHGARAATSAGASSSVAPATEPKPAKAERGCAGQHEM